MLEERVYTKEARKLVYDFAFNQLGVDEIHAQAWEKNENSCKSMERVGFKLVRQEERLFEKYGRFFQENHYCLTKETWEIIKDSYGFPFGTLWMVWLPFFVVSVILSVTFLVRYRSESNANLFLSLAVLLSSLSSLGVWSFYYYLARIMGG